MPYLQKEEIFAYEKRNDTFLNRLNKNVLFAAGPIGSSILNCNPSLEDYGGLDGCNEYLTVSKPEIVAGIQREFYAAGCDAVDSATFGANKIVFAEYGIEDRVEEINYLAAKQLTEIRDEFSTTAHPTYAFGTMGPGTKLPSLSHVDYNTLVESYRLQTRGLIAGGIDVLKVETCQDLLQTKAALGAIEDVFKETNTRLPVIASVTIETTGTMLLGSDIGCALTVLESMDIVDIIGLNCATGPEQMVEHVRYLAQHSRRPIFVGPNAGLPEIRNGETWYPLTPEDFARYHNIFVNEFGTSIAAGCCGTTPEHFKTLISEIGNKKPNTRAPEYEAACASLYTSVPIKQDTSFLVIGERLNATGSKAFKESLLSEDIDRGIEIASAQAGEGAHVLDLMVDYVGRDGPSDMEKFMSAIRTQSTLPLILDSTELPVIETGLALYGGKAIVNSINLEDGERKIRKLLPLIKRFGAGAIALTIDEEGQARTTEWKIKVAKEIYELAVEEYGMEPGDLLFDMLTFPLSSGQEDLRQDAIATLDAIKEVKETLPGVHTVLGVSNISFGLKPSARRVLNSVFLAAAIDAGLDAAIVNAKQIVPLHRIPEEQVKTATDLIYDKRNDSYDPLLHFISLFENDNASTKAKKTDDREKLPVGKRLELSIVDGERRHLSSDLDKALQEMEPLQIINTHLLEGMRVVGELFGSGKMQLPFVLQSAETMKAAVTHLEPFLDRLDISSKGKVVLATVRGDVHDIGKNLVDIILSNNGYTVHNLGIKQPIINIIEKAEEVGADALGLSGLLVKSTVIMRENLEELNARNLSKYPVLLGGAALNRRYVEEDLQPLYNGNVFYCKDAFEGLTILENLDDYKNQPRKKQALKEKTQGEKPSSGTSKVSRSNVQKNAVIPEPPFWGSRVVRGLSLREIYKYINQVALFRGQWQYQKGEQTDSEYQKMLTKTVEPVFRKLQDDAITEKLLQPEVVYGYFPCKADGNKLNVWKNIGKSGPEGEPVQFNFPRQTDGRGLCISDFFKDASSKEYDTVAFHIVTVGKKASEVAGNLFKQNQYKDYLHLHGFGVETAEALAEFWHKRIREELGIANNDAQAIRDLFAQGYQGSRYSFGYPACPDLEQQVLIANLLDSERIGVSLTETFQWEPEQTTSAIIVHHPDARYFTVKQ